MEMETKTILKENAVYNMDCMDGLKLIASESVDLIITDPPYEVNYNNKSKELSKLGKARKKQIDRDASFVDKIPSYKDLAEEWFRVLKPDSHCYIFCGDRQIRYWHEALENAGFKPPQVLVWRKLNCTLDMTMGHKFPENKEFLLFFHKGWKKLNGYGIERKMFRSCMTFPASPDTKYHSCAKPMPLINFLLKLSSNEGDLVLDSFMGSGQTAIASKGLKRSFIGFELSEEYFKTINRRLQQGSINDFF